LSSKEYDNKCFLLSLQFSPSLADGLQKKSLDSKQRNEFNRDVCAAIKVHTLFLTKEERQRVAYLIIEKYPFLADTLGCQPLRKEFLENLEFLGIPRKS